MGTRISAIALLTIVNIVVPATIASTTTKQPLEMAGAVEQALAVDEQLKALTFAADAQLARARADSALPDPQLSIGYQGVPVDSFSLSEEMMTMLMVGVSQRFPAGRTRSLRRERGNVQERAIRVQRLQRALDVSREVRLAWLDWRFAHDVLQVLEETALTLTEIGDLVERQVAAGIAGQYTLARARLEEAAIGEQVISWQTERDSSASMLSRWLGTADVHQRTPGAAPRWAAPEPVLLRQQLDQHPALQQRELRQEVGQVDQAIAREAYKPEWMVEVSYGFRQGRDGMSGERRADMLAGMVSFSLPLFPGNRQDQRLSAARQATSAARHEVSDQQRVLAATLEQQQSVWRHLDDLVILYQTRLGPEATRSYEAALQAYRDNQATLDEVLRSRITEFDYQLGELRAVRDRDRARVELLYLAGE